MCCSLLVQENGIYEHVLSKSVKAIQSEDDVTIITTLMKMLHQVINTQTIKDKTLVNLTNFFLTSISNLCSHMIVLVIHEKFLNLCWTHGSARGSYEFNSVRPSILL